MQESRLWLFQARTVQMERFRDLALGRRHWTLGRPGG